MKPSIELRIRLTEAQAERLRQRIDALPFKVTYQEEQHGSSLQVIIGCTVAQERLIREILHEVGAVAEVPEG